MAVDFLFQGVEDADHGFGMMVELERDIFYQNY